MENKNEGSAVTQDTGAPAPGAIGGAEESANLNELETALDLGNAPITDEQLQFLEDVAQIDMTDSGLKADDLGDVIDAENREVLGVDVAWPDLKGASIRIAHYSSAAEKRGALERKLRERKGIPFGKPLGPHVEEQLWRMALFGTVVKGWSGIKLKGHLLPFSELNYRKLINIRRFRAFVLSKSMNVETFKRSAEESAEKNS